ncbi:MAG: hypothetical protein EOP04_16910 [Proteobacteria bacterium]|nr:MAG: hypothetical protein EOP04_16910 [Pseudomonadota bacterium]
MKKFTLLKFICKHDIVQYSSAYSLKLKNMKNTTAIIAIAVLVSFCLGSLYGRSAKAREIQMQSKQIEGLQLEIAEKDLAIKLNEEQIVALTNDIRLQSNLLETVSSSGSAAVILDNSKKCQSDEAAINKAFEQKLQWCSDRQEDAIKIAKNYCEASYEYTAKMLACYENDSDKKEFAECLHESYAGLPPTTGILSN